MGICAFFYMQNLFSVVVFHRSMVQLEEEDTSDLLYMCILLYMKTYLV